MSSPVDEVAAMICFVYVAAINGCSSPPDDDAMLAKFRAEHAWFEAFRESMCKLPKSQDIWTDSDKKSEFVPESELEWHRETLVSIGADHAVVLPDPCRLWIDVWAAGGATTSTDRKAYRFGPPLLDEVVNVEELDGLKPDPEAWAIAYQRRIEGDWWLEYSHFR